MGKTCTVDPQFEKLIPRLQDDEYHALEASIKADGCMHPIITWKGLVIDGHNRLEICKRLGAPFRIVEKEFSDREHAMVWMLNHQLARRNLTDYARGVLALQHKDLIASRGKPGTRTDLLPNLAKGVPLNTRKEVAKLARVSPSTIATIEQIEKAAAPEIKQAVRDGDITISVAAKLAKLPEQEQEAVAAAGRDAMKMKAKAVTTCPSLLIAEDPSPDDEIETLKAENARLSAEIEQLKQNLDDAEMEIKKLRAEEYLRYLEDADIVAPDDVVI